LKDHDRGRERLGRYLVRIGVIQEVQLVHCLAEQLGHGVASAESMAAADNEALSLVPEAVAREAQALPLRLDGEVLEVAMAESLPDTVLVRYRIDGVLHEAHRPPRQLQMALISRIKVLADLDIAVRLAPQDGRFTVNVPGHSVDVRVSTLPTVFGEKVVMRLF